MDIKKIYQDANALLSGHFILSSGNHSPNYLQSAKVLEEPNRGELLAKELAEIIRDANIEIDTVCAPALVVLLLDMSQLELQGLGLSLLRENLIIWSLEEALRLERVKKS